MVRCTLKGVASPRTHPLVRRVRSGIRRTIGTAQHGRAPLLLSDLRCLLGAIPSANRAGLRDRALLLLGWTGVLRRSELVTLDLADVRETPEGVRVWIGRSKTDQEGISSLAQGVGHTARNPR